MSAHTDTHNRDFSLEKIMSKLKFDTFLTKFWDSIHFQLTQYTVFDEESDVQVKNQQFRSPGARNVDKLPPKLYVSIHAVFFNK